MLIRLRFALAQAIVFCAPVFSQTFGEITGMITDTSGAIVAGATITVVDPATNFNRVTTSNNTGHYTFPSLRPSTYSVRVEMAGFTSEIRNSVELQVQQVARIDFQLKPGAVSETVEVVAGAPLLNTENATVGTVIEQKRIEDLPLNGRSFISLIALSPNVVTGQTVTGGYAQVRGGGGERGLVSLSVGGTRREFTHYTLDGVSNTSVDFNTYAFLPSIDALQEFKVQTGVYSAEFGREAAQVNVSTRAGTNSYHGTLFEFLRNNAMDARPYAFTSSVPVSAPFKWNQYGFTLGGPIQIPRIFDGKNRLFFMSNYEGFKLRNQGQRVFSVPPSTMRGGNFSQLLPGTVIRDPLNKDATNTKQPFPNNIIPATRFSGIAVGLLEYYPLPNIAGTDLVNNYLALQHRTTDKDQFSQRIDFVENASSTWFGRYSWQEDSSISPNLDRNGITQNARVRQAVISNTRLLSPTVVNELRGGYLGYYSGVLNELAYVKDVTGDLGIPLYATVPPVGWGIPQVSVQGYSAFGDNGTGSPFAANNHTFQLIDNLSWTRGSHSLKIGAEIRRDRYDVVGANSIRGTFTIQNQATGYGFSDYMLGYLSSTNSTAGLAQSQLRATSQAYFIADNWKVRPNLTIEAGLRYEYTPAWSSKGDNFVNMLIPHFVLTPNAPKELHPYFARDCAAYGQDSFYAPNQMVRFDLATDVRCQSGLGSTLVRSDRTDFAPRLGISWSPQAKMTIRAGVGFFYVQDASNSYFDLSRNIAGKVLDNADFTTNSLTFEKPFNESVGVSGACGVSTPPYICLTNVSPLASDPDRRTPYLIQYLFNIQRQLSDSTVLEVGYLGSQGHKLQRLMIYNGAVPATTGSIASRSPFPQFGKIQSNHGVSNSNYHSVSARLSRRLSNGLSYMFSYTLSKALDNGSAVTPANGIVTRQPQLGWCAKCEYSRSDFDSRHRFVASILYELPLGKGKAFATTGWKDAVLGGWQLNSIVSKSSGFPLEILAGTNQSNSNIDNDRPNVVLNPEPLAERTTGQWFNIRSYVLSPFGSFGNAGHNTETSPGVFSWDFSTFKNISITERSVLQFRFECFNCANHPNFGDPGTSLAANRRDSAGFAIPGTGSFGQITNTRPGIEMRQLQLSLKLMF